MNIVNLLVSCSSLACFSIDVLLMRKLLGDLSYFLFLLKESKLPTHKQNAF